MLYDPQRHHRHSIRLPEHDYSSAGIYFFTVCTHQRECHFGEIIDRKMVLNGIGKIIAAEWRELTVRFPTVLFDTFVVMPNHIHGILILNPSLLDENVPSLSQILRALKSRTAIAANPLLNRIGQPLWQRNYFEHIIRNEQVLEKARCYILLNPERWNRDADNLLNP